MIPDPLTFAQQALGCRFASQLGPMCATHAADSWPCPEATRLAALIEARDAQIRADECEQAAALVRARVTADNANLGPNGRSLERRAIAKALRERATQHRTEGDTNG
jgi:hypothetical protein